MKKLFLLLSLLSGIAFADGVVQLQDITTGANEQKFIIGVPTMQEFNARTGSGGSLVVSNITVTGSAILPAPLYFGDIYTGNLYASNSITIQGTNVMSQLATKLSITNVVPTLSGDEPDKVPSVAAVNDAMALKVGNSGGTATNLTVNGTMTINGEQITGGSPTNGISVEQADVRYSSINMLSGVWLFSGTNKTDYSTDFANAYANAVSGDMIRLGEGSFAIGDFDLVTPNVSIIGMGQSESVLNGALTQILTATNIYLSGFTLLNTNASIVDTFMCSLVNTNTSGLIMDNIDIRASAAGSHVAEFSGDGIYLNQVRTFISDGSGGHPFVLKGIKNARVINCSSTANGMWNNLLIKSAVLDKGVSSDIFVSGFSGTGASVGLKVVLFSNSSISNLTIFGSAFYENVYGVSLGGGTDYTNNLLINSDIDVVVRDCTTALSIQDCAVAQSTLKARGSCTTAAIVSTYVDPGLSLNMDIDIDCDLYGRTVNHGVLSSDIIASSGPFERVVGETLSVGPSNSLIRVSEVTDAGLNVVINDSCELYSDALAVGDPVWIDTGTLDGVYRLLSWGDVTTNDVPITGALVGDQYILTSKGTKTNGVYTCGHLMAGKIHGYVDVKTNGYNDIQMDIECSGFLASSGYSASRYVASFRAGLAYGVPNSTAINTTLLSSTVGIKSRFFKWGNDIYVGVFGGVTDITNLPRYFKYPRAKVVTFGVGQIDIGYKRATTLPE